MTDLRKPVRRIGRGIASHGFSPDLAITLYPGGVLGIRELRRRKEYRVLIAGILERAVVAEVAARAKARRTKRRGR